MSKFFFASRTGDIFSRFSGEQRQARSGRGARDTLDGEMPRKRICVSFFFPADFPVARVSRFTVSPEKLEKIAGQLASHAGVFRGAQIRAPQKTPA